MKNYSITLVKPNNLNYLILITLAIISILIIPTFIIVKLSNLIDDTVTSYLRMFIGNLIIVQFVIVFLIKNYSIIGKISFDDNALEINIFKDSETKIIPYNEIVSLELNYTSYKKVELKLLNKMPKKTEGWNNSLKIQNHTELLVYNFLLKDVVEENTLFLLTIFLREKKLIV